VLDRQSAIVAKVSPLVAKHMDRDIWRLLAPGIQNGQCVIIAPRVTNDDTVDHILDAVQQSRYILFFVADNASEDDFYARGDSGVCVTRHSFNE